MPVLFRYPQEFQIMQYCDCATHENDIKVRRLNSQTHENDIKVRILNSHSNSQIIKTVWFATFGVMMLNTTFNNISVISWRSVLLVEEIEVPGENHRPITSH